MTAEIMTAKTMTAKIMRIGVFGLGPMGRSIARVFLEDGHQVQVRDIDAASSQRLMAVLREEWGKKQSDNPSLTLMDDMQAINQCDLVIETVTEDEDCKRKALTMIGKYQGTETIVGTNTSGMSITSLSRHMPHPHNFLGVHFMKPPDSVKLIEVIKGLATSRRSCDRVREILEAMGRKVVFCEDSPAFIVNRILMLMINEAVTVLYQGVGSVESIDQSLIHGAHHPMGPLQLADLIGLDLCASILERLRREIADDKYRPCPLLLKYVEAGWLGRKTRRGFYDYHGKKPIPTR